MNRSDAGSPPHASLLEGHVAVGDGRLVIGSIGWLLSAAISIALRVEKLNLVGSDEDAAENLRLIRPLLIPYLAEGFDFLQQGLQGTL
jgi:hypothetical protein